MAKTGHTRSVIPGDGADGQQALAVPGVILQGSGRKSSVLPGEVHVWTVSLLEEGAGEEEESSLLSAEEQCRAGSFRFGRDRFRFVTAHAALRRLLAPSLGVHPAEIMFTRGMYGKPEIVLPRDAPPVQFNLSHAGDLALVVVAFGAMVGVDCEAVHDDFEVLDVARKFFSRPEIEQIRHHPLHERCAAFTRCWTRKEALIKGIGTGLSYPLDAFSIDVDIEGAQSPRNEKAPLFWPPGWIVMNVPLRPGYQGAVAVRV